MRHGSLVDRVVKGSRWVWTSADYRAALPADLDESVLGIDSSDRHHAKQGRSTSRVRFDSPWGPLTVYLKKHLELPWKDRLAAMIFPEGRHTPGSAEWSHLEKARSLGIRVPDAVAAGEWIGPWGKLQSFLMVAELTGQDPLHEAIPRWFQERDAADLETLKREIVQEMAQITARLHGARMFHKDLYLCHFFLDPSLRSPAGRRLTLIDLHRLGEHHWFSRRWRLKDLGQLLFSTYGVPGINERDRLRFWATYRRLMGVEKRGVERWLIVRKANLYRKHNR